MVDIRVVIRLSSWIAFAVLVCGCGSRGHNGAAALPDSPSIAAIRECKPAVLNGGHRVHFTAVVTYWEPRTHILVVTDGTAGILVDQIDQLQEFAPGANVEVSGLTEFNDFVPLIAKARVRIRPNGLHIQPIEATDEALLAGKYEYQLISAHARLESYSQLAYDKIRVTYRVGNTTVRGVVLRDGVDVLDRLVGREVVVPAVPVSKRDPNGKVHEIELLTTSAREMRPLDAGGPPPVPADADPTLAELTTIAQIKALTKEEAGRRHPVHFRAVVTVAEPPRALMMVHDGTLGLYVYPVTAVVDGVKTGDSVEVRGYTLAGGFAPMVRPTSVRVLGKANLPLPAHLTQFSSLLSPSLDNAWVGIECTIRSVGRTARGYPILHARTGRQLFDMEVMAPDKLEELRHFANTRVSVAGVWSPLYDQWRQLQGFQLIVPGLDQIRKIADLPVPSTIEPISSLRVFRQGWGDSGMVRVAGVVTASREQGDVWIQDSTGGVRLKLRDREDPLPQVGQFVVATALAPRMLPDVRLDEASVEPGASHGLSIKPEAASVDDCASGYFDSRLIQVEGYVTDVSRELGDTVLQTQFGRTEFWALLEGSSGSPLVSDVRAGSLVRLTGVCSVVWDAGTQPATARHMELVLRSPADLVVVTAASWWTRENALLVLSGVAALSLIAMALVLLLRRQVRIQSSAIKRQLEREADLQHQLDQARRLEAIGRLAGGIAHDFNNLLTVILGYSELLRAKLAGDPATRQQLDEVLQACNNATALVRQLLAYGRRQAMEPQIIDLNAEIRSARPLLQKAIDESIRLELVEAEDVPSINVDATQLNRVLINLAANARDAMPDGGTLTIETSHVSLDQDEAKRLGAAPGNYARVVVSDTGAGMSEETKMRLFEPFFTTKEPHKGTGLGLATVYGIVTQSGGHILVETELGVGTSFKLLFPAIVARIVPKPSERGSHASVDVR